MANFSRRLTVTVKLILLKFNESSFVGRGTTDCHCLGGSNLGRTAATPLTGAGTCRGHGTDVPGRAGSDLKSPAVCRGISSHTPSDKWWRHVRPPFLESLLLVRVLSTLASSISEWLVPKLPWAAAVRNHRCERGASYHAGSLLPKFPYSWSTLGCPPNSITILHNKQYLSLDLAAIDIS